MTTFLLLKSKISSFRHIWVIY